MSFGRQSVFVMCLLVLASCGGGGGGIEREGTDATPNPSQPMTTSVGLTLTQVSDGMVATQVSEQSPLRLTVTATNSQGQAIADTLVTFTLQPEGLAVFGNDSGTARTNATGTASIDLLVGENSGAGQITATLSSGETANTTFDSTGTTQQNARPGSLQLLSSSLQLASSGSDQIELMALVKDRNNVILENINVTFAADQGANLQLPNGGNVAVTGPDGIARAFLNTLNQPENRVIRVNVSATGLLESQSLDIQVVGTQVTLDGASSVIINDPAPITLSVTDSDGNGIANQVLTVSAASGTLSNIRPITTESGQVTINYTASAAGEDVITASALNVSGQFELVVQEDDFGFSAIPDNAIALGQDARLTLTWLKDNQPFANGNVTLTASRGDIAQASAQTDALGLVSFTIRADNAGFASVSATGIDNDGELVSARTQIEFVATQAHSIIVDATPDSIGPSGQTATISAVVRDPNGNLVKGKVVNFVVDDVSGGSISVNQGTTDRSGIASTVYTSNAVSSFEAVEVQATVADTPVVTDSTLLTVGNRSFDISIGTGRLLEAPQASSYSKQFSIFVTDPDSNPVPNANLTFAAPPVAFIQGGVYHKGNWLWDPILDAWVQNITVTCPNEDINGDGILNEGEDVNGDGQLTPGNVVSIPSSAITDDNGQALIDVLYAIQFGGWAEVDIHVQGESAGSESEESQQFSLQVLAADLQVEGSPPPNSPYGQSMNCNDAN